MNTLIDYNKISAAVTYYTYHGYEYIDVPWLISPHVASITAPPRCYRYLVNGYNTPETAQELPASGEQSLLEIRSTLKNDHKYVCVTPCFRDELQYDDKTREWFIKVELMWVKSNPDTFDLPMLIVDALEFFRKYDKSVYYVKTEIGWDININGHEVGSYGIREYKGFKWIYGTGVAEPRLTYALQNKREFTTHRYMEPPDWKTENYYNK